MNQAYNEIAYSRVRKITDEESSRLRMVLLEIAGDVKKVCEKYNLKFMMAYGTLLGAVRHQGFIPWDDDMDFMMFRRDYEKLIEIFDQELSEKYVLQVPDIEPKASFSRMKIRKKNTLFLEYETEGLPIHKGIFIDIAPLDKIPTGRVEQFIHRYVFVFYRQTTLATAFYRYPSVSLNRLLKDHPKAYRVMRIRQFLGRLFSFKSLDYWNQKTDNHAKKYLNSHHTLYSDIYKSTGYHTAALPYESFCPAVVLPFENTSFLAPRNFEGILEDHYGDYWVLPEGNKQLRHWTLALEFGDEESSV
jgi:lipopolysaccharide cholinephosphotransferase